MFAVGKSVVFDNGSHTHSLDKGQTHYLIFSSLPKRRRRRPSHTGWHCFVSSGAQHMAKYRRSMPSEHRPKLNGTINIHTIWRRIFLFCARLRESSNFANLRNGFTETYVHFHGLQRMLWSRFSIRKWVFEPRNHLSHTIPSRNRFMGRAYLNFWQCRVAKNESEIYMGWGAWCQTHTAWATAEKPFHFPSLGGELA